MNISEKLAELLILQEKTDAIREELKLAPPGKVLFLAPLDVTTEDTVVVEADGFGGATTMVIEGNYPVDYVIKFERLFPREREAENAAEQLAHRRASPGLILAASE